MSQAQNKTSILTIFAFLAATLCPSTILKAAPDISGPDLVIDAPWRTARDYLPVLFFTPEFEASSVELKLDAIRLSNYNPSTKARQKIFVDSRSTEDDEFDCSISFIDPEGEARSHMTETETVDSFWHYIARVPVSCIGFGDERGKPGEHYLYGEMDWSKHIVLSGQPMRIKEKAFHVLRVIVTPDGFAKFSPVDHLYDVHVHTVAEQTKWHGALNLDASKKAYGGPLAMLMESAYALGMVDVQLRNGNWSAFRDQIITTDHNSFFSKPPYDAGTAPGHGPTSHHHTDGKKGEFNWYRKHLGELGGQEITVNGANGHPLQQIEVSASTSSFIEVDTENGLALGSHLLAYGAEHIDGPWHGGGLVHPPLYSSPIGAPNHISITNAISHMGESNGFGYASHPESENFAWSDEYYERAIGLYQDNKGNAIVPVLQKGEFVQKNQSDFVFKGLQIWNGHADMVARKSGHIDYDEAHRFDPYSRSTRDQQFIPNPKWRGAHDKTYEKYKILLRRGLEYSFKEDKDHVFIRKLYLSAGTDSHAAFNDDVSMLAAHLGEIAEKYHLDFSSKFPVGIEANNNAFGRLRTYTLTSQRYIRAGASIPRNCETYPFCDGRQVAPTNFPLEDYKEGNTVATDGPVGRFSTDANCRFDSDIHELSWHDDTCVWENHDGMIGGRGKFDGGNTMLAPVGNSGVMMRYDWIGKNDYRPDSESDDSTMTFNLVRIKSTDADHGDPDNGYEADGFHYYTYEDNAAFRPGQPGRSNAAHINEVLSNPPIVAFPHKSALILEGALSRSQEQVLMDPANAWFPGKSLCKDGEVDPCVVVDPNMTKFVTNPIWIAPYRISVDPIATCPIRPGELKVTVEFGISMDTTLPSQLPPLGRAVPAQLLEQIKIQRVASVSPRDSIGQRFETQAHSLPDTAVSSDSTYDGIRVLVKPLDQRGNSSDIEYEISDHNGQWQAVEIPREIRPKLIADAKYTTTNTMEIPCGAGWNAENPKKKQDQNFASYAIVVDQIHDMHMNYLNPIARTISTARPSSPFDPVINEGTTNDQVLGREEKAPEEKACSTRNNKICGDWGARCEVAEATNGAENNLCRWSSANSANKCRNTVGIWTTAQSRYAKNHPGVVPTGSAGACVTEVKNLKNRIQ